MSGPASSLPFILASPEAAPSAMDQPNQAGRQSRPTPPAVSSRVESPTFSQPHQVCKEENDEKAEESEQDSFEPAMDQTNQTGHQAGQSSRGLADAGVVHSPTFSEPHLIVIIESEEKLEESEQESSEPAVDQPDRVGHQAAGQSSRGLADAGVVHSPTFSEPHLIVIIESEEKLEESEQESSEPAVNQPDRVGQQAAGQSSWGPADARAVNPLTFSEPHPVDEIASDQELVAPVGARSGARYRRGEPLRNPRQGRRFRGGTEPYRNRASVAAHGRQTRTRSLRMNATSHEETHNF